MRKHVYRLPPELLLEDGTPRIIIHLDLDAFYVGASRLRDPSLNGLPVGVKQKTILATVSYEARALGCSKLGRVSDCLQACPSLILVDGEDLSFFRATSRRVFTLISNRVGTSTPVEKLGLDELWLDVTSLIDAHLTTFPVRDAQGKRWFELSSRQATTSKSELSKSELRGFFYDDSVCGHVEHPGGTTRRYALATHLAAYLREQLQTQLHLSASAGISFNKLLAKLAGTLHKPSNQTVFVPSGDANSRALAAAEFVAHRKLRKLGGFGSLVLSRMTAQVNGQAAPQNQDWTREPPPETDVLTAGLATEHFSLKQMTELFGSAGPRLFSALWGQDSSPVVQFENEKQISVEDTYPPTGAPSEALRTLASSLLTRLETELRDDPALSENTSTSAPVWLTREQSMWAGKMSVMVRCYELIEDSNVTRGPWLRWPSGLRLSLSYAFDSRMSRQTSMPVEVFDDQLSRAARLASLVRILEDLKRGLARADTPVRLLNIAAIDLRNSPPNRGLTAWLAAKPVVTVASRQSTSPGKRKAPPDEQMRDSTPAATSSNSYAYVTCSTCGDICLSYLLHDHSAWPERGVPPWVVPRLQGDASDAESIDFDLASEEWQ